MENTTESKPLTDDMDDMNNTMDTPETEPGTDVGDEPVSDSGIDTEPGQETPSIMVPDVDSIAKPVDEPGQPISEPESELSESSNETEKSVENLDTEQEHVTPTDPNTRLDETDMSSEPEPEPFVSDSAESDDEDMITSDTARERAQKKNRQETIRTANQELNHPPNTPPPPSSSHTLRNIRSQNKPTQKPKKKRRSTSHSKHTNHPNIHSSAHTHKKRNTPPHTTRKTARKTTREQIDGIIRAQRHNMSTLA